MKKLNNNLMTASEVYNNLGISVKTLTNWYKWYYNDDFEKPKNIPVLPMYEQTHKNGPRFWTVECVEKLKEFQKSLPKGRNGVMGAFSKRYWSNYEKGKENE